jgi:hypothetical protein
MAESAMSEMDRVTGRMDSMKDDIAGGFGSLGDLFGHDFGDEPVTAESIKAAMDAQSQTASDFRTVIDRLQKMGLRDDLLQQLLQAGPESLPIAQALVEGGKELVNSVNKDMKYISSLMKDAFQEVPLREFGEEMRSAQKEIRDTNRALIEFARSLKEAAESKHLSDNVENQLERLLVEILSRAVNRRHRV